MKHLDMDPNIEKMIKFGTTRPEQLPGRTQKIFRLSMTGFRPKKASEGEVNFSPSLFPSKTPKARTAQENKKELNIAGTQMKADGGRKVKLMQSQTQNNFFSKPSQLKTSKLAGSETQLVETNITNAQKPNPKGDVITLRAPSNAFSRTSTAVGQQRQFMKIPINDLYTASIHQTLPKHTDQHDTYGFKTMTENNLIAGKNNFFANISNENFEEEIGNPLKFKRTGTISTLESSSQLTKLKNSSNFSLSTSQNTLFASEAEKVKLGNDPMSLQELKSSGMKVREKVNLTRNAPSKKVTKFNEDVEKAKIYNDQMIKQFQFDRENEEEEHDFAELCEILKSNIKV